MDNLNIIINDKDCCGSKMCENLAPNAFILRDDGYAAVRDGAENCPLDVLKKAARSCPAQCIILYQDGAEIDLY